jgi:flagellar protein FliO/FliZ
LKKISKKAKGTILLIIFMFLFSGAYFLLFGKQYQDGSVAQSDSSPSFLVLLFKTILLLGFIIVLIYGILYLLKRFVYQKNFGKSSKSIEMLEFSPLIGKKSLCVVKVVDRILVLGVSESGINKLSEIDDVEVQKKWLSSLNPQSVKKSGNFAEYLQNFIGHNKN